jgi:O-antigen ligase
LRLDTFSTLSGRSVAWEFAWQQIQTDFFIGKGFSYTEYIYKINYDYLSMLGHQGAAHNSYLTFWLDTGLIGLILFLIGLGITFFKASKLSPLAMPLLYAVLLSNNFESWITASLNPFTIQLLIILSVIFNQKFKLQETLKEQ